MMQFRVLGHYIQLPLLLLWLSEVASASLGCRVAGELITGRNIASSELWAASAVFGACVLLMMLSMGLFNRRMRDRLLGLVLRISIALFFAGVAATVILSTWTRVRTAAAIVITACALAWVMIIAIRRIGLGIIDEDRFKRRVLVYGTGRNALKISKLRRRSDQRGFRLVGFAHPEGEELSVDLTQVLDTGAALCDFAMANAIDEIVVAMDDRRRNFPLRDLLNCRIAGIEIIELIGFLERETGKVHLDVLNPSWVIFGSGFRRGGPRVFMERVFDLLVSSVILVIASPFMLLTAVAIKLEDGRLAPVFYRQARVGFGGRVFDVLKFRSMVVDAEKDGVRWAAANDSRVTHVGALIRKTRIDELPQLLNVFRGEMSFVGPRPERPEFVKHLTHQIPFYQERHSVKPGITGWAQLCYSYGASERDAVEKLQYDLFYVKHHDLIFDLLILLQTVEVILFGKGAR